MNIAWGAGKFVITKITQMCLCTLTETQMRLQMRSQSY